MLFVKASRHSQALSTKQNADASEQKAHKTKPKAKKSDLNSVQIAKSPLMLWKALVSYHPHMPPTTSATEFRKNS